MNDLTYTGEVKVIDGDAAYKCEWTEYDRDGKPRRVKGWTWQAPPTNYEESHRRWDELAAFYDSFDK